MYNTVSLITIFISFYEESDLISTTSDEVAHMLTIRGRPSYCVQCREKSNLPIAFHEAAKASGSSAMSTSSK